MKYEIEGGGTVEAPTALGIVEALREDAMAWAPTVGIEDYMEELAARSRMTDDSEVRTDSVENFVTDLVACGFLTPVIPVILGTTEPRPAENALLSAIIQAVPAGSQWFISSDSWSEIPNLLAFASEPTEEGEWKFRVSEETRPRLQQVVEQHELGEKIVHMTLLSAADSHLFHSYDCLMMIIVDRSLGITADLQHRFPTLDIYEE